MAKNTIYFTFCGTPIFQTKRNLVEHGETTWGGKSTPCANISFGVKVNKSTVFVGLWDSIKDTVKTSDVDNQLMEFKWEDRNDPGIIEKVANYKKFKTDIGSDETKSFVTAYDLIEYLEDALAGYESDIVVNGTYNLRYDNKGILRKNFNITSVWKAREDDKRRLSMRADLYYLGDALDKSSLKETSKMFLDSYVEQYINKDEGSKFVPMQTVFDVSKYDDDNDHHQKLKRHRLAFMEYKKKTVQHMLWELRVVNGAEEVEFTEDQLTPTQKDQIDLGIRTLEDFKPKGSIRGPRMQEIRLLEPICENEYADGLVDSEMKPDEFEEKIYTPPKDIDDSELEKEAERGQEEKKDESNGLADDELF